MIVPEYWAESRVRRRDKAQQVTVRRFGWSDESQAEAQAMADRRAEEALERVLSGSRLLRREPKVPYNGADGVPIREEIVARHGETVITRNSYGARCLNTPNVLFADIDFATGPPLRLTMIVLAVFGAAAAAARWATGSWLVGLFVVGVGVVASYFVAGLIDRLLQSFAGGPLEAATRRVRRFAEQNPAWNLRVYRTPAGLRLLATHRTFDPDDPEVAAAFTALGVDPIYALMCRQQKCFRARVTAKPWRIGIADHLRPRPGVWPIAPDRLP